MFARTSALAAPLAALLLLGGCAYDYPGGYAPQYPAGYDDDMGSGQYAQPGDQFGGQNVASVEVFYETLAPYGRWIDSRFGYAFQPQTQEGWRPYVNGRWGEDRLWISDDPWGWATDHYGRWGYDDQIGWVWVPGTEWAPSWVAWREADQVTGWAPIPPGVNYSVGVGFGSGFGYDNFNSWYQPSWVWVPSPYLFRPGFGGNVLPWNNGVNYWRGSRWNYNYGRPGIGRPGYGGPGYGRPGYGRPGTARPPVVRPGNGQGNRPVYVRPRDGAAPNVDGRPYRGDWQGERPNGGQVYGGGRPNRVEGDRGNRPPGFGGRRPDRTGGVATPGTRPDRGNRPPPGVSRPAAPVATAPPVQAQQVQQAPPPVRYERPTRTERPTAERQYRGGSGRGQRQPD